MGLILIAIITAGAYLSLVSAAPNKNNFNVFDLRQALSDTSTCSCPTPISTLVVLTYDTTVTVTVAGSGTITTTATPSTTNTVTTTTVTSTVTAPAVTRCVNNVAKRQEANSPTATATDLTSTTVVANTVTTTVSVTNVETMPAQSTVTSTMISTTTATTTLTPTVTTCSYVTIITISGRVSSTTTLATANDQTPGTVALIYPSTYTTSTYQQTAQTVQTATTTVTAVTQTDGSPGTVFVIQPNYVVTTITSGTTGLTSVLVSATGTQQGTVVEALPTPNLDCNNRGFQYAIQSNPYSRGLAAADPTYSSFDGVAFRTATPQATGVTNYLGVPLVVRNTKGSIYGNPPQFITQTGVNHRAYLYAKQSGNFTFDFPQSDDITLLWVGPNAYGPNYRRSNANLQQLYSGSTPASQQIRYQYNVTLQQGQYVPFRVLWGNAQYEGQFEVQIHAPDGTLITNSSSTFPASPYIVQYSCDGVTAPAFAPFGQEAGPAIGTTTIPRTTTTTTTTAAP